MRSTFTPSRYQVDLFLEIEMGLISLRGFLCWICFIRILSRLVFCSWNTILAWEKFNGSFLRETDERKENNDDEKQKKMKDLDVFFDIWSKIRWTTWLVLKTSGYL